MFFPASDFVHGYLHQACFFSDISKTSAQPNSSFNFYFPFGASCSETDTSKYICMTTHFLPYTTMIPHFFFFFLAALAACASSWAKDQTCAKAVTRTAAATRTTAINARFLTHFTTRELLSPRFWKTQIYKQQWLSLLLRWSWRQHLPQLIRIPGMCMKMSWAPFLLPLPDENFFQKGVFAVSKKGR